MATQKKDKKDTRELIMEEYMKHVLMHNEKPKSVFAFAEMNKLKEGEFYEYFGSFEGIDAAVFVDLFNNTMKMVEQDEDFQQGDAKHKLLSFYFTYFEMLTANRSFIVYILKQYGHRLEAIKTLTGLRKVYTDFVRSLDIETIDLQIDNKRIAKKGISEGSFAQLILVLKFWLNDTSPSFEKTDVLIEKSIHAGFEMINIQPFNTFLDLGKFLWKEKMGKN